MNNPQISIIYPVYNVRKFLDKSLGSILSQSFGNFEIIAVDDGSTDGSSEICDRYAQEDSRVIVIHKSNGGVSAARQDALNIAKGEYILGIDSDDWIGEGYLERMHKAIVNTGADMVCGDVCLVLRDSVNIQRISNLYGKSDISRITSSNVASSFWNKLIRRDMFVKHKVSFPVELKAAEDVFVVFSLLIKGAKCVFIDTLYYYNRINNLSITSAKSLDLVSETKKCAELLDRVDGDPKVKSRLVREQKDRARLYAFEHLDVKVFLGLYPEDAFGFFFRNILKLNKINAYAAMSLVLRRSDMTIYLYRKLKSLRNSLKAKND